MVMLRSAPTPVQFGAAWRENAESQVKKAAGRDGRVGRSEVAELLRAAPQIGDNIILAFEAAGRRSIAADKLLDLAADQITAQGAAVAGSNNVISLLEARMLPHETRGDFFALRGKPAPDAVSQSSADAQNALASRLTELRSRVKSTRKEIGGITKVLGELEAKIEGKRETISQLQSRKRSLESQIESARNRRNRNRLIGAFFGGWGGLALADAVSNYQNEKRAIEAQIAASEAEERSLKSAFDAYDQAQGELRGELKELKAEERNIETTLSGLGDGSLDPTAALGAELATTSTLARNLRRQLKVLKALKSNANDFSTALDEVIRGLQAQLISLSAQKEAAEAALFASVIDLVIASGGLPKSVDLVGMRVSTKAFIIDADKALKSAFHKQLTKSLAGLPEPLRRSVSASLKTRLR